MNDRDFILNELKYIPFDQIIDEWNKLKSMSKCEIELLNGRSQLGCKLVDFFFFHNRLETIGNKGINFYDFAENIELYKNKKYIQNLLSYCEKNNRYSNSIIKKYYYCYGLCFGRVNAFKITNALQIYYDFNPKVVLDPFAGFGGRMIGAMLLNIDYIGIDVNKELKVGYDNIRENFAHLSKSKTDIHYTDSVNIDYSLYKYDMVFTSPPYENIEIYKHSEKKTTSEWNTFYNTIFKNTWDNLQSNGIFAINVNKKIYEKNLLPLIGDSHDKKYLKKSSRNDYEEYIYIWKK
jgi:DNA modification methylase